MLTNAEFYVIVALMHRPRHGYEILLDVQSMGHMRIGPATLYTTLKRMLEAGLITEVAGPAGADSRRRYYRITARGRAACEEERKRLEASLKLLLRAQKRATG